MPNYFSFKILKAFNISLIFKPSTGLLCCGINGPPDWVEVALNCHPNIIHNLQICSHFTSFVQSRNQTGCLEPLVHIYHLYSALIAGALEKEPQHLKHSSEEHLQFSGGTGFLLLMEFLLLWAILLHDVNN